MPTLVRGQFPRRELSGDAKPAAPRPKVARCSREMGVIALSKLVHWFAPLAGLAVELQLGARVWQRAAAAELSPSPSSGGLPDLPQKIPHFQEFIVRNLNRSAAVTFPLSTARGSHKLL